MGEQIKILDNQLIMKRLSKNRLAFIASLNLQNLSNQKVVNIWIKYETAIQDSIKNNGKQYTLELYKSVYVFLRNILLQLPTQPLSFCKVDSKGIPKPLWPLRPLINGERDSLRVALSIARSYEQIRLNIDYSCLDNVTLGHTPKQEETVKYISGKFTKFLTKFTQNRKWYLGTLSDPIQPWSKVLTTLAKGPNGPAVASSHLDAVAVVADPVLYPAIKKLNLSLRQDWITDWLDEQTRFVTASEAYSTGRIGFSAEPAGKTRLFAIGDYWSQLSLKPLQISLNRTLGNISTDTTRDQDGGFKSLLKESAGHPTYCFDLSSASDRIPAEMQKHRLELMKDKDLADSWFSVMTKRDFDVKALNTKVRWKVGQPLGLLSSFPSFALWHHDIIQLSANWENIERGKPLRFFKQYRLLGDDVVIFNTKVARRYQWILNMLGLTVNMSKSVIGDKIKSQIEFTKRLALRGIEMSSIKHNILSKEDKLSLFDLVELLHQRDFISPDTGHHGLSSILKSEDQIRLDFMIWLRNSNTPTLSFYNKDGDVFLSFSREDMIQRIVSKRTQSIIEKTESMEVSDIEKEILNVSRDFKESCVPCNEKALVEQRLIWTSGSHTKFHPILVALTQTLRELQFMMFTVLDDLEPGTASPVEYLPVVSSRSYFNDRKDLNRYFSKILHESLTEARHEYNQAVETNSVIKKTTTGNNSCSGVKTPSYTK